MGQIVRALRRPRAPPTPPPWSERLVGAASGSPDRFDRALALAVADGLVVQTADGRYAAT